MRVIVATNNAGKMAELRALLPPSVDLLSLADVGLTPPEETGTSFQENATLKALAAASFADAALADDSGLEVEALEGAPGIRSARFAGEEASDEENNLRLLDALKDVPESHRQARFVSSVVLALSDGRCWHAEGSVSGRILKVPRGQDGFGYDPLLEIDDPAAGQFNGKTVAELSREEKNTISHRARAYQALLCEIGQQRVWPAEDGIQ